MFCPNGYSSHRSDIESWYLWEHCVKTYMKNFAASPYYHVIIMYVCLGGCTYWLTPIFYSVPNFFTWINFEFFIQTQVTLYSTQIIWWTFSYDAPSYFSFPLLFRQFCVICGIFKGKVFGVVVESLFEQLFYNSKVNFVIVVGLGWTYFSLVNYIWR